MTTLAALAPLALTPTPAAAQQQAPGHYWQTVYSQTGTFAYVSLSSQQRINGPGPQLPTTNVPGTWPALPAGQTANGGYDTGGMDATNSGTVTATLTWVPYAGQTLQTDPPPKTVILQESASASWGVYYPGTGSPTGWSVSDGLGDPTVASASGASSAGSHLVQEDGSSGTITVSCSLSATGPTSAWQPYPGYPTYGNFTWPGCSVDTSFSVQLDTRYVTISCPAVDLTQWTQPNGGIIYGSRYKSPPITGQIIYNVRQPDGTMRGDTVKPTQNWSGVDGTPDGSDYLTYSANVFGTWGASSDFLWNSALTSDNEQGTFTSDTDPLPDFAALYSQILFSYGSVSGDRPRLPPCD